MSSPDLKSLWDRGREVTGLCPVLVVFCLHKGSCRPYLHILRVLSSCIQDRRGVEAARGLHILHPGMFLLAK